MDDRAELVKNWIVKAQHDLLAAQKLSRSVGWVEECWRSLFVRRQPNTPRLTIGANPPISS
jgi:hypothetical protein